MKILSIDRCLWIWVNRTTAAVINGDGKIAGGQAHIAFGRSGEHVREFIRGMGFPQTAIEWRIPIARYGSAPAHELRIVENPELNKRSLECRIPSQSPQSAERSPLWDLCGVANPSGEPRQLIIFLRDEKRKVHLRILGIDQLHRLPDACLSIILSDKAKGGPGYYCGSFNFQDGPPNVLSAHRTVQSEQPSQITASSADLEWLSKALTELNGQTGARAVRNAERAVRDPRVRKAALSYFGMRCLVFDCRYIAMTPEPWHPQVLEVHHLKAVRRKGNDALDNLVVLCAMHHRLCEGKKPIYSMDSDDVFIRHEYGSFYLERDLSRLRQLCEISE